MDFVYLPDLKIAVRLDAIASVWFNDGKRQLTVVFNFMEDPDNGAYQVVVTENDARLLWDRMFPTQSYPFGEENQATNLEQSFSQEDLMDENDEDGIRSVEVILSGICSKDLEADIQRIVQEMKLYRQGKHKNKSMIKSWLYDLEKMFVPGTRNYEKGREAMDHLYWALQREPEND